MGHFIKQLVLKYWFLFFVGCVALFMAVTKVSVMELWNAFRGLSLWQFGVLLGIYSILSALNVGLRKYLLLSLGQNPSLKNLWFIHFTSMAAHYSTPVKLGFPVTVLLLNRLENVQYAVGTTTVLVELAVSTGICGLIGVVGTFYYFSENHFLPVLAAFVLFCIFGLFTLERIRKNNPTGRIARSLAELLVQLRALSIRRLIGYFVIRTLIQFCTAMNLFLLCVFFSLDISYFQAVVIGSSAFFVGAVSMVPMGLGVREGSVLFYLARFGVGGPEAISIVGVQRIISTGVSFVLGTVFGAILGVKDIEASRGKSPANQKLTNS